MTEAEAQQATATVFGGATPILRVQSLTTSIDYYAGVLGFKVDWHEPGIMASVSRNRCSLMLCEGDQGNPGSWVWIGVGDVEILFAEYQTKGRRCGIHQPTIRGRVRCKSRTLTVMCCDLAQTPSRIGLSASGATCTAIFGR